MVYQIGEEKLISIKADEYKDLLNEKPATKKNKTMSTISLDTSNTNSTYTYNLSDSKPVAKDKLEHAGQGTRRVCEC